MLFYGALIVLTTFFIRISWALYRKMFSLRRGLLYAFIALLGAWGLIHGGVAYFTWMYGAEFQEAAIVALRSDPSMPAQGVDSIQTLKVIDYRQTAAQVLVADGHGKRWTLHFQRLEGKEWNGLPGSGAMEVQAWYGWLGL
jgi:hypothetical protein